MSLRPLLIAAIGIVGAVWLTSFAFPVEPEPVEAAVIAAPVGSVDASTSDNVGADAFERVPFRGDDAESRRTLSLELDRAIRSGGGPRAQWGVIVFSLDYGDTLFAHDATRALAPASNLKLATSVAALHHLGPDFRYRTWALTDAPIREGVIEGDVILYGTGDPGIGDRFWRDRAEPWTVMADQLRAAGIHEIRGRVLGDGTFFSGPAVLFDAWESEDLNEWYGAASPGLSYNENVATLRIRASAPGLPPIVETVPDHTGQAIANEGRTVVGSIQERIAFLRDDPIDPIRVAGQIRAGSGDVWRQMSVGDPVLFAAHGFTHVLRDAGIVVAGDPGTVPGAGASLLTTGRVWGDTGGWQVVAELRSPPLSEYLAAVNQRSHNLYADVLLKTLGRALEGQGSFAAGARVVTRFVTDELGVPAGEVHIVDGSGLAGANRLSPRALIALIDHAETEGYRDALMESLALAGSRSLRRMSRTGASGNLRAKTGTISRVSALSGTVTAADGERLAFSIIGNDLSSQTAAKRQVEDRIGAFLAAWSRGPQAPLP